MPTRKSETAPTEAQSSTASDDARDLLLETKKRLTTALAIIGAVHLALDRADDSDDHADEIVALAAAHSVDEVVQIRDRAEAARAAARIAGDIEMVNWAAEIRIRAERRAGELLREMEKAPGGQPYQSHDATSRPAPTLSDLGIDKHESSRWQREAAVRLRGWSAGAGPDGALIARLEAACGACPDCGSTDEGHATPCGGRRTEPGPYRTAIQPD